MNSASDRLRDRPSRVPHQHGSPTVFRIRGCVYLVFGRAPVPHVKLEKSSPQP